MVWLTIAEICAILTSLREGYYVSCYILYWLFYILTGCAWVTATPAPPGERVRGIPIYDVKPILIVTANSVTVEMVPNYNRAYGLRFGSFLAKHQFKATITNGIITSVDSNQDSTDALKLLGDLGEKFLDKVLPTAQSKEGGGVGAPQRFGVFSFDFDKDGNLVGLRPLMLADQFIRVPKAQPRVQPVPIQTAPKPDAKPNNGTGEF